MPTMGGSSDQVFWKQHLDKEAESVLTGALSAVGKSLSELNGQSWDPNTSTIGGIRDIETSFLAPASPTWSSVLLPLNSEFGPDLAERISASISGPSMVFFEFDQTAWGYGLFRSGKLDHQFWNFPEEIDLDPDTCRGSIQSLVEEFGVPAECLEPYLVHSPPEGFKAFPEDEFCLDDHWVRTDFMKRLGLTYPEPGQTPGARYVHIR